MLTCIGTIAMYYIMVFIASNEGLNDMPGSAALRSILFLGTVVIAIFAFIFLFYTNNFLLKQRKKEFGLYNILGMDKQNLAVMIAFETLITSLISLVIGILIGILFSKIIYMVLLKALGFTVPIIYSITIDGIRNCILLFGCIFSLMLLRNIFNISSYNPIELIKGSNVGEKEPKAKWISAIIGFLCLGVAYYIAVTTENPLSAIFLFFIAVVLVIIGTYLLFETGSIVILKVLRKNKSYYYKPNNFLSISNMIYRMKQNAKGLANICILSTMVIVMVAGTVSLYFGIDDCVDNFIAYDMEFKVSYIDENNQEAMQNTIYEEAEKHNIEIDKLHITPDFVSYLYLQTTDNHFVSDRISNNCKEVVLRFFTEDSFNQKYSKNLVLTSPDNVAIFTNDSYDSAVFEINNTFYNIQELGTDLHVSGLDSSYLYPSYYVIFKDLNTLSNFFTEYTKGKEEYYGFNDMMEFRISINVKGNNETQLKFYDIAYARIRDYSDDVYLIYGDSRASTYQELLVFYGGFLFLGIFLGTLFIMAMALIMYYKQIVEGYDDKKRFEIMRKVGLSDEETKHVINSQIIKIFFLPLVVAIIHYAFAFKLITRLLQLLNLTNVKLFFTCSVITIIIFALMYLIVYLLTAKVYYKIISEN